MALLNGADISGSTVSNFEDLIFAVNGTAKMSAATWDQFVATTGSATVGHTVQSAVGVETVILSTTTPNVTTAYSGTNPIEQYVLSSADNDFFRFNAPFAPIGNQVDLSGGGSDMLVLNSPLAGVAGNATFETKTLNFQGGATAAGGDVLQVQLATNSISSGTSIIVTAMDTDVTAERTIIINSFAGATMDEAPSQTAAQAAVNFAIDEIQAGIYTVAIYFSGGGQSGAYVWAMETAANDPGNADFDLIGILSSTAVNTLTGANFT
jgi:hypothetical protein